MLSREELEDMQKRIPEPVRIDGVRIISTFTQLIESHLSALDRIDALEDVVTSWQMAYDELKNGIVGLIKTMERHGEIPKQALKEIGGKDDEMA